MVPCFDVPNLDAICADADDYAHLQRVFDLLSNYCAWKRGAVKARLAGEVAKALKLERFAQERYEQLPQWARW